MKIYTDIPLTSPSLIHAKLLLQEKRITLERLPFSEKMVALNDFLLEHKIPFLSVTALYEFEGHVHRSDLYSGRYTSTEKILVVGYTKKCGSFSKRVITRTGVNPDDHYYSGDGYYRNGTKFEDFLENLNRVSLTTQKESPC